LPIAAYEFPDREQADLLDALDRVNITTKKCVTESIKEEFLQIEHIGSAL